MNLRHLRFIPAKAALLALSLCAPPTAYAGAFFDAFADLTLTMTDIQGSDPDNLFVDVTTSRAAFSSGESGNASVSAQSTYDPQGTQVPLGPGGVVRLTADTEGSASPAGSSVGVVEVGAVVDILNGSFVGDAIIFFTLGYTANVDAGIDVVGLESALAETLLDVVLDSDPLSPVLTGALLADPATGIDAPISGSVNFQVTAPAGFGGDTLTLTARASGGAATEAVPLPGTLWLLAPLTLVLLRRRG